MKKYIKGYILCLFFALFCPLIVYAEEFTSEKSGLDIMFVMDYSGSMKSNDSQDIARGMVKTFVDTVHSADIRVGFVAYNDRILTSTSPTAVQTAEERSLLKMLIDQEEYSGNTDIGLGLSYGIELLGDGTGRKQVIVLISDGESDLAGSDTGRTTENSRTDMGIAAETCAEDGIQIYSIAFGDYDGNTEALKAVSEGTSAQMYTAETPERLIEILYGIFGTNLDYSIQEIADSVFAPGIQNIRVALKEGYLDEINVLLISPRKIGDVTILYGGQEIETVNLGNYAVGKITEVSRDVNELTVQAETLENQELQLYLISYRSLTPVLEINTAVHKNVPLRYELYFRDGNGNQVADAALYQNFTYHFSLKSALEEDGSDGGLSESILDTSFSDGCMQGETLIGQSGNWIFQASLEDGMGSSAFEPILVTVENRLPEGSMPEAGLITRLTGERQYILDEYFSDPDGDALSYALEPGTDGCAEIGISGGILTVHPKKTGKQTVILTVSDGEGASTYEWEVAVTPLWQAYWWLPALAAGLIFAFLIWKIMHRRKPELEQLETETRKNHFCGKLDAYFTVQPETEEEIPPLSFQMHKVRDNKINLGSLLREYPAACDALELGKIFLVADEGRRMILYHNSKASVMVGNSIICRQIQYSVSFGDVIYIASEDGAYDLEIHYIAVIQ